MKNFSLSLLLLAVFGGVAAAADSQGILQVEIKSPAPDLVLSSAESWIDVRGSASTFGGMKQLDLFLVMDTSSSLRASDPEDQRLDGAIRLVESLPARSDTRVGIVEFDTSSELILPLTSDRAAVIHALRNLDRSGSTDLAGGIRTALSGLENGGRPGAVAMMLVFTDGKSKRQGGSKASRESEARAVRRAMQRAKTQGVAIHALLLGSDPRGGQLLREIAYATHGSFVQVRDPKSLPQAFLNLRTAGVDHVSLWVDGSPPIEARLIGSSFSARVPLHEGVNEIVATATSLHGVTRQRTIRVVVREPGCAELQVEARRDGIPALSVSNRAVEIVIDASRSMWGRMQGRPKMSIAKETMDAALEWLPEDLELSLRAYGNANPSEQHDCRDSELLVGLARNNRDRIREAIAGLRPNGQTPIAFALEQIAADFSDYRGERAVILVTDGIESCAGDPVAAARELQELGSVPVHVIGFGLSSDEDEDVRSLQAIAAASGGRFVTAGSAQELREAIGAMVGTPFQVWSGERSVARGALGSEERIRLPGGDYVVRLESLPPRQFQVRLSGEERLTLAFERDQGKVSQHARRSPAEYATCEAPADREFLAPAAPDEIGVIDEFAPESL
ncbi:MAG: VWA domain-containing protein [Myxococcales bacterium]|nr:VWA domain-containing protein [Myxococcales bacterium]